MAATHDDAILIVQLMRWGTELGIEDAMSTIFSPEFDPVHASMADPAVRNVLGFGETVGALVKHNLLDVALVRDIFWIDGIWEKVGPHALAAREQECEPSLYENFEALVTQRSAA
jgi:hypothetical protein